MRYYSELTVLPDVIAHPPRHFGLNVEMQDHHEQSNLWDWIADSGSTCIRTFHPEQTLRGADADPAAYAAVTDAASFDIWRQALLADVDGQLPWANYRFTEAVPWMGQADGFVNQYAKQGVEVLYSLGYWPTLFPRPLVKAVGTNEVPGDDGIDWGAAACAYEYYLAVMHRYATRSGGRVFMMINEPENRFGAWYLPDDLKDLGWGETFWDDASPGLAERVLRLEAVQYAVLARFARLALEDVRASLSDSAQAEALRLTGPTTVAWKPFWQAAEGYLDALDYHHYHPDARTFASTWQTVAATAAASDKPVMISEFNRHSGGLDFGEIPFVTSNALDTAALLFQIMNLPGTRERAPAWTTLYLLGFPSTHRNYKHLVYGSMDVVDWTGRDTPLWDRGDAWYPTFEESQLRHPTPAYDVVRMLARHSRRGDGETLAAGLTNPTTSGPADIYDQLEWLVTRDSDGCLISILNRSERAAERLVLDLSAVAPAATTAVVRVTDRKHRDEPLACHAIEGGRCEINVPAQALVQVIVRKVPLVKPSHLRLVEQSWTPGSIHEGLALFQTTRLGAVANLGQHTEDIGEWAVRWSSSHPHYVRVGASGLVQRLRSAPDAVTITATVLSPTGDDLSTSVSLPGIS